MLRRDEHLHMFTFLTEIQIYCVARPEYQPLTALPDDVRPGPLFHVTSLWSQVNNIAQSATASNINMHHGVTNQALKSINICA